ncbi:hypothetical protein Tco_0631329 [Tanacetum coccineum]
MVPTLITKVDSLETELNQTKQTMGKAIVKLVKKVKKLENILKRRNVVLTTSEDEEPEDQGRIFKNINDDPLRSKSVDKGKRYKRRKESNGKDFEDISIGFEEVNTGGLGFSTGSGPVSSDRGQREGKAQMIVEETQAPKRTKEQIQQEEASLAEAIRLQNLEEEETAKQVHLDALLAKRLVEEEELTEQQKQRKAQVQFEAQHYTEEDWDAIRAKLEANAELAKSVIAKDMSEEDFAKRMVDLVNQRKKYLAKERAKAKRKLQTKISKKQRIDDKDVLDTEEKVGKVKEEEPVKRVGTRKKQKARKVFIVVDRKYPLSKRWCQVMLKMNFWRKNEMKFFINFEDDEKQDVLKLDAVKYQRVMLLKSCDRKSRVEFKNNSKDNAHNILRKLIMKILKRT